MHSGQKSKVVLDTNIIVSALLSREGTPAQIILAAGEKKILNHLSPDIIAEIEEVLSRPKIRNRSTENERREFMGVLGSISTNVTPSKKINLMQNDPADNKILECAIEAKAEYIITGDNHLLTLKEYKGIRIITANEFLKKIAL